MAFTWTHLQPMSTDMALKVMNHPLERSFNMTVKHGMLKDMEGVGYLKKVNRADRPDSWYNGKMTNRTVPQVSRRPTKVAMTPGSHVVSDIGYVTIPDRNGNKYWVLYKDLCSQHREVYRMKRKDDIVDVWCQYITDNEFQDLQRTLVCRIRNFITDADASYIEGKVKEVNEIN